MTLSKQEFLRRFELHFLPHRFVKIRHYGFMQNHGKVTRLNEVRKNMDLQPLPPIVKIPAAQRMLEQHSKDMNLCPKCEKGKLILIAIVYAHPLTTSFSKQKKADAQGQLHNKASP